MMKRPWLTAALWAVMPIAMNVPLLWSPGGTKMFAFLILVAIIGINAIVVPASSVASSRRLYSTKFSEYCNPQPLYVIAGFSAVITYIVFSALGMLYTFSNAIANSGLFVLTAVAIVISFIQAKTDEDKAFLTNAILLSLPLLVAANLAAFAVGLSGTTDVTEATSSDRINQTLGLIGITTTRIAFPLTFGINGFGAIAAVSWLICTFQAIFAKGWIRTFAMVLWPGPLVALAMTDARGAVAYAIFSALFAYLVIKRPTVFKAVAIPIVLTPFVPSLGYRFFELANQGQIFSFMVRPGTQGAKLGFGTGRGEIWESILTHLTKLDAQHIIGYGAFGQVTSGVSKQYAWVFNELGSSLASCHNAFLQYLMDGGYIGAAIWMAMLVTFAKQTYKIIQAPLVKQSTKYIVASLLGMTITQTQTEVFGTIYTPEILILIISIVSLSGFLPGLNQPAPAKQAVPWRRRRLYT